MTATWSDAWLDIHEGDCRAVLRTLPAESVHTVVTSPPYWSLRDYGVTGQLGLEKTPEEYVATMVDVFREVRRVLRADGTLWLNLGDSYNSGTSARRKPSSNGSDVGYWQDAGEMGDERINVPNLAAKQLIGMPWRLAFALQADGWYLRSDIIWAKPNPMPESVTDRPTKSHEYVFLLSKSARYFYDADAVREITGNEMTAEEYDRNRRQWQSPRTNDDGVLVGYAGEGKRDGGHSHPAGRNLRSVWTIATAPYPGAHFATFPPKLVEPCILAGTSERGVCPECGAPWVRVTDVSYVKSPVHGAGSVVGRHYETGANGYDGSGMPRLNKTVETTGWRQTCAHGGEPVPATVMDIFGGTGTVGLVAQSLSRRAVLIDLNADYLRQCLERNRAIPLGM